MNRITTIASVLTVSLLVSCSTKERSQEEGSQRDTITSLARSAGKDSDYEAARQSDSVARANMLEVARMLVDRDLFPESDIVDRIQQLHLQGLKFIREEHRKLFDDSSHYRLCQIRVGNIFNTAAYSDAVILLYDSDKPRMVLYNDSTKVFRFMPEDIKLLTVSRTHLYYDTIPDQAAEIPDDFFDYRFPASIELKNGVISIELWGGAMFTSVEITYDKGRDILQSKEFYTYDESD